MTTEYFEFTGAGGTGLPAVLWLPECAPTALLQIAHGMTEHMGRYETLAAHLTSQGIAVAGFDLRGHGKNPGEAHTASFGEGGWARSVEDMHLFFRLLEQKFPRVPHYMLGFSLGSFLLREYLGQYPRGIAGAVIMGTGHQPGWLMGMMMGIVKGQIRKAGFDRTTDLVRQLSFGSYNQKFRPARTEADWLCSDEAQLNLYLADPLVRRDISSGLFWELLGSMKRAGTPGFCASWEKEMPVLLLSGQADPVGGEGKGVLAVRKQLENAGVRNITFRTFPDARHDLLHEEAICAEAVRQCIADWIVAQNR